MKKDIRLYIYDSGGLRKNQHPIKHNHKSVESCEEAIENYELPTRIVRDRTFQFVIVEYMKPYDSKIIKVITKTYKPTNKINSK